MSDAASRRSLHTRSVLSLLALLALVVTADPVSAQHQATLKRRGENVFASLPFDPVGAAGLTLSPNATRSAYVRAKDGGFCAVIDGAEGPVYSRIGRGGVVFSGDSLHSAYAAEKDGKWHVVGGEGEGEPFDAIRDDTITVGAEGGRLAYVAQRGGKALVVIDGRASAPYDRVQEGSIVFDPGGARVAYAAADDTGEFVVHEDVRGSSYEAVGRPHFSRDGMHLVYAASAKGQSFIVLDGAAGAPRPGSAAVHPLSLTFNPAGQRLAYVASGPNGRERVVVDGADGNPFDRVFDDSLTFSADGTRLAYVAKRGRKVVVVAGGAEVGSHDGVVPVSVRMSPDGRRVAYIAERGGRDGVVRRCVAVDGVEGSFYDWIGEPPVFSLDGRHVAFVAERRRTDGGGFESFLVADGAESAGAFPWIRGDPVFTPDGRRVAYLAAAGDNRFAAAGAVPRQPGNPAAGARLVFHLAPPQVRAALPGEQPRPVKLLVVEEDLEVD